MCALIIKGTTGFSHEVHHLRKLKCRSGHFGAHWSNPDFVLSCLHPADHSIERVLCHVDHKLWSNIDFVLKALENKKPCVCRDIIRHFEPRCNDSEGLNAFVRDVRMLSAYCCYGDHDDFRIFGDKVLTNPNLVFTEDKPLNYLHEYDMRLCKEFAKRVHWCYDCKFKDCAAELLDLYGDALQAKTDEIHFRFMKDFDTALTLAEKALVCRKMKALRKNVKDASLEDPETRKIVNDYVDNMKSTYFEPVMRDLDEGKELKSNEQAYKRMKMM